MIQSVSGHCCCCCFLCCFYFFLSVFGFFLIQNVTPLMETALNSGLSFIKHVDCGRGVSKEAYKVLIEKKNVDFYCWLRKWELCYLESMERQLQLQLKMIFL